MHTEDEAANLFCPYKTSSRIGDGTQTDGKCVGSKCMAWRWVVSSQDETHYLGFCGLAGRPFD